MGDEHSTSFYINGILRAGLNQGNRREYVRR